MPYACFLSGCCQDVLHDRALVRPHEIALVGELGLTLETHGDKLGFALPCSLLQDNCCTVYTLRPSSCRRYQCALLKEYLAGRITLEQGLRVVHTAQTMLTRVRSHLPPGYSLPRLRRELLQAPDPAPLETAAAQRERAELLLHVVTLNRYLQNHFHGTRPAVPAAGGAPGE